MRFAMLLSKNGDLLPLLGKRTSERPVWKDETFAGVSLEKISLLFFDDALVLFPVQATDFYVTDPAKTSRFQACLFYFGR